MAGWSWAAFIGGVFGANSVPHLSTVARRGRMLTPLGGHDSGPAANLVWGVANFAAGAVLVARARPRAGGTRALIGPFLAGAAAFGVWASIYERMIVGSRRDAD